ncbi:hypothetical protein SK128_026655 [Halocaridina rubra]|uniref:HMG box domain-containing protein n=1 Tax=Halocaridina rubra TaxID=373956 RepID=A0AAN9AF72_HALRR
MGKKKQGNGFYFFMVEKKPELEKKLGRKIQMSEMPGLVDMEWKNLPSEQKLKYREMGGKNLGTVEKLDCRGVPLSELRRQQKEKNQKTEDMKKDIANSVDFYRSGGALHRFNIYIANISYYVYTDEGHYTPAELSIAEFCFEKGIMREYHAVFKPEIPLSYGFTARQHSSATHKLLDDGLNHGLDTEDVVLQLQDFFKMEEKIPPLYTLEDQMECVETMLDTIAGHGYFSVYSLTHLFQHFYSAVHSPSIPLSIANDFLTHCGFDYHPALACKWHKLNQPDSGKYCTQSCVRRWIYNMCDNMLLEKTFGITPLENKHLPRAVRACGVCVDFPIPDFKVNRNTKAATPSVGAIEQLSSFSLTAKEETRGAYLFVSSKLDDQSKFRRSTSAKPLESLKHDLSSAWNRKTASIPSSDTSGADSLASVCFSTIDTTSEDDFPALGACAARSGNAAGRGQCTPKSKAPSKRRN